MIMKAPFQEMQPKMHEKASFEKVADFSMRNLKRKPAEAVQQLSDDDDIDDLPFVPRKKPQNSQ